MHAMPRNQPPWHRLRLCRRRALLVRVFGYRVEVEALDLGHEHQNFDGRSNLSLSSTVLGARATDPSFSADHALKDCASGADCHQKDSCA
jgi:hypothetical protein